MFPLQVTSADLVSRLKKAIKAEKTPTLDHLAADQFTLWKLSTPLPTGRTRKEKTDLSGKIQKIKFPDPGSDDALDGDGTIQILDPPEKLSTYWQENPEEKHLHFIVQVPQG